MLWSSEAGIIFQKKFQSEQVVQENLNGTAWFGFRRVVHWNLRLNK
jgi:hypothetical protein